MTIEMDDSLRQQKRLRMRLRSDLWWLHGFPFQAFDGRQAWMSVPIWSKIQPEEMLISVDRLNTALFGFKRLVKEFPAAIEKTVDQPKDWVVLTKELLKRLKQPVQFQQPLPQIFGKQSPFSACLIQKAERLDGPIHKLAEAIGWTCFTLPHQLKAMLDWVAVNQNQLVPLIEERGPLALARGILMARLATEEGCDVQPYIENLNWWRHRHFPLEGGWELIEKCHAGIRTRRFRGSELPSIMEPDENKMFALHENLIYQIYAAPKSQRISFLQVLCLVPLADLALPWESWWQAIRSLYPMYRQLDTIDPFERKVFEAQAQIVEHAFDQIIESLPKAVVCTDYLEAVCSVAKHESYQQMIGILEQMPDVKIRHRLLRDWFRWPQDQQAALSRYIQFLSQFLVQNQGSLDKFLYLWEEHPERFDYSGYQWNHPGYHPMSNHHDVVRFFEIIRTDQYPEWEQISAILVAGFDASEIPTLLENISAWKVDPTEYQWRMAAKLTNTGSMAQSQILKRPLLSKAAWQRLEPLTDWLFQQGLASKDEVIDLIPELLNDGLRFVQMDSKVVEASESWRQQLIACHQEYVLTVEPKLKDLHEDYRDLLPHLMAFQETQWKGLIERINAWKANKTHSQNNAFLASCENLGLLMNQWVEGPKDTVYDRDHGQLTISVEQDPLETIRLGMQNQWGGLSFGSALAVALDLNKQLLTIKKQDGKLFGHCVLGIAKDGGVVDSPLWLPQPSPELTEAVQIMIDSLCCNMGTINLKSGEVEHLSGLPCFHGATDVFENLPFLRNGSDFRCALLMLQPGAFWSWLEDLFVEAHDHERYLAMIFCLPEFRANRTLVEACIPQIVDAAPYMDMQVLLDLIHQITHMHACLQGRQLLDIYHHFMPACESTSDLRESLCRRFGKY